MVDINNQVSIEVGIVPNAEELERFLNKIQKDVYQITAELQLDTAKFTQDIKKAIADKIVIPVELEIDSTKFEQQLDRLTEDRTVKVKVEVDEQDAQKGIENAANNVNVKANVSPQVLSPTATANFSNEFKTDINPNINLGGANFDASGIIKQIQECCDHIREKLDEQTESIEKTIVNSGLSEGLRNESVSALKAAIGAVGKTVLFPLKTVLTGSFEGIGQGLTKDVGASISKALGDALRLDSDKIGTELGLAFGKAIRTQLENLAPNFVNKFTRPITASAGPAENQKPGIESEKVEAKQQEAKIVQSDRIFAQFKLELANVKGALMAVQKDLIASQSVVVSLTDAFNQLKTVSLLLVDQIKTVASRAGVATRKDVSRPPQNTNPGGKLGFIKADPQTVTKDVVKQQVQELNKTLQQLNKEILDSSNVAERNKKLQQLLAIIKRSRSQINADIKNDKFPTEIKRSLAAYNRANSNLDRLEKLIVSRLKKAQTELAQLNREQISKTNKPSPGTNIINNVPPQQRQGRTGSGDILFRGKGLRERGSEAIAEKIGAKIGNAIARKIFEVLSGQKTNFSKIKVKDLASSKLDFLRVNANKVEITGKATSDKPTTTNKGLFGRFKPQDNLARSLHSEQQTAIDNYLKVFREVVKRSGIDPKLLQGKIPNFKVNQNLTTGEGFFNTGKNTIELSQSAVTGLSKGNISKQDLTALIHEFRHALQTSLGKLGIADIAKGTAPGVKLIPGRTQQAEESTRNFIANRRQQGRTVSEAEVRTVRSLENDAELFARKTAKAIANVLRRDTPKQRVSRDTRREMVARQQAKSIVIHATSVIIKSRLGSSATAASGDRLARTSTNRLDQAFRKISVLLDRLLRDRGGIRSRQERSQLRSEVAGFAASASILNFPRTSLNVITAPLQVAFSPFIATIGLATKVLSPFVSALSETLKILVPIQSRFKAIAGSAAGGAELQGFTEDLATRLNLPILAAQDQFSKIVAAAKGTKLEGKGVQKLFEGISLAIKALGLNSQDSFLVFQGFLQILSKNRLSFEELRLQIAERFPPAIGVFSRALGVSTEELNKLVRAGISGEEALSKVAKQLKLEFGEAGVEAANNYISALTRIENATFKLQSTVAKKLEGFFTGVASAIASVLETLTSNVERVFAGVATLLIGLFAQVLVGASYIIAKTPILTKAFESIIPTFSRLYVALSPFAVGLFADLIDDFASLITGREVKSSIESITSGLFQLSYAIIATSETVSNVFQPAFKGFRASLSAIADYNLFQIPSDVLNGVTQVISDLIPDIDTSAIGEAFSSLFGNLSLSLGDFGNFFGSILKDIFEITKGVIAGVAERIALILAVIQTFALGKFLIQPIVAAIIKLKALGIEFLKTGRKSKVFKNIIQTLKAGLNDFEIQASIAIAGLLAFFSSADLFPEFRKDLDKLKRQTNEFSLAISNLTNRKDIEVNVRFTSNQGANNPEQLLEGFINRQAQFESKGFDVTFGLGNILGIGTIRTDDLIKNLNKIGFEYNRKLRDINKISQAEFERLSNQTPQYLTLAEKQANQLLGEISKTVQDFDKSIGASGLFTIGKDGIFDIFNTKVGESLASVKDLDDNIRTLSQQRAEILIENPDADISKIDAQLEKLLKERNLIIKPAIDFRDKLLRQKADFSKFIDAIESSNQPQFIKDQVIERLKLGISQVDAALEQVRKIGLESDIDPLAEQFNRVSKEVEAATTELEKLKSTLEQIKLDKGLAIAENLASGFITEDEAKKQNEALEKTALESSVADLTKNFAKQRDNLFELLKIPTSEQSEKQTEAIANQIKLVDNLEKELTNNRISLANKVVAEKKAAEQEIIKNFNQALSERRAAMAKEFADSQQQVLELQLAGDITEEVAAEENLNIAIDDTVARLQDKKKELKEIEKLRRRDIDLLDDTLTKEQDVIAEIDQLENELLQKRIDQIKFLRDARIQAIKKEAQARTTATDGISAYIEKEKRILEQYISFIDIRISLLQSKISLDASFDRVDAHENEADLAKVNKALDLRQKLQEKGLKFSDRISLKNQLSRLGFGTKNESAILQQRQQIEEKIARDKAIALAREQEQQRKLLDLEEKRRDAVAKTALIEANLTKLKASQQLLQAIGEQRQAKITGDQQQIQIAEIGVEIARGELTLADVGLDQARQNISIQEQLAKEERIAKLNDQRSDRIKAISDNPNVKDILSIDGLTRTVARLQGLNPRNFNGRGFKREIPYDLQDYAKFLQNISIPQTLDVPQREIDLNKINQATNLVGNTSEIITLVSQLLEMQRNNDTGTLNVENVSIRNVYDDANQRDLLQQVARNTEQGTYDAMVRVLQDL